LLLPGQSQNDCQLLQNFMTSAPYSLVASYEKGDSQMVSIPKHLKALEIEKRAAQVRREWSTSERIRRTGLPPDVPARLEEFILGKRQPQWSVVSPHKSELVAQ
jgi:hypothetical protein